VLPLKILFPDPWSLVVPVFVEFTEPENVQPLNNNPGEVDVTFPPIADAGPNCK